MEIEETELLDCYVVTPKRFGDDRGYFSSVPIEMLKKFGFDQIHQVSNSMSGKGIVRGLHYQKDPYCQAKVVRCHQGAVLDVVVDVRKDSETYGKSIAVELTPENGKTLFVPRGFAHGFVSLKENTLFEYYVDNKYMPRLEDGILWNDPELNIDWEGIFKKYGIEKPVLSDKDKVRKTLKETNPDFTRKQKKYLITGYKGQLGYDIARELEQRGEHNYLALDINEMDITNREQVMDIITTYKPDVIFHCAAWTAVDKAEDPELQEKVKDINVIGTKNITDASIEVGAKLLYMSTDYVFDGTKEGLYNEENQVNPKSIYGLTKYLGEEEARRNPKHFITRISWVFGINGNNFIKTMLNLSDKYNELKVVNDQIGSPTYTVDLARLLVEMAQTEKYGTYHANNEGYCSWAEFADYIMKINNKNTKIIPVTTEEYYAGKDMSKVAYRPRNSKLDKTKLKENFYALPTWQDATERYSELLKLKDLKTILSYYKNENNCEKQKTKKIGDK